MSDANETKVCPLCAESIKLAAKVCPLCRHFQKKWSLQNPQVWIALSALGWIGVMCFFGIMLDGLFGPKDKFATYRNEISIVDSQFSCRMGGSNLLVTVVGTLTNHSNISWKDVGVEAQFLDKSGKLIDAITANADGYNGVTILSHGEAAFKIEARAARPQTDYENCKLAVRWAKETGVFP